MTYPMLRERFPQLRPLDESNRALMHNTRPDGWTNPVPARRYNLVVLGAGTAGLVAAAGAAGLGARVALIERALLGGDCLNSGCVPSKALLRCARAVADFRSARDFGVVPETTPEVDFAAVMDRMRRLRARISEHDSARRFADLGVDVFIGNGRFTGVDRLEVDGRTLRFAKACLATGSRPVTPPIEGLEEAGYLTNETVFSLTELPRRLAVIGGGPIGVELGQAFARFGAEVVVMEMADRLLPNEDPLASGFVRRALEEDGVRVLTGVQARSVERTTSGRAVTLRRSGENFGVEVDALLVSAGRSPNVRDLGLESAGVVYDDKSGVRVDDRLRTSNRRIFAAGDVCSEHRHTHVADAHARAVIRNALFFGRERANAAAIPRVTYTDPEIAHVGMERSHALREGIDIDTIDVPLDQVDRAVLDGEEEGLLRVHAKRGSGEILGATLIARHAGEMISEITLAIQNGLSLGALSTTIHPYPTQAEVFRRAGDVWMRRKLTPRLERWLGRYLAWRR